SWWHASSPILPRAKRMVAGAATLKPAWQSFSLPALPGLQRIMRCRSMVAMASRSNIRGAACCAMRALSILSKGPQKFRRRSSRGVFSQAGTERLRLTPGLARQRARSGKINENREPPCQRRIRSMAELSSWLRPIALGAALIVLLLGLWNMMRGGPSNRSQLLMRWRVGLQFLALIIIMTGLYLASM